MKKMSHSLIFATIGLAYPALASDMPIYPIDSRCQAHWQANAKMTKVCIRQQQASHDALNALWTSIPAEITEHCRGEWDKSKDYVMLHFCVEQQVLASKNAAASDAN